MRCCSSQCERYNHCARAIANGANDIDQVESLYTYGTCAIQWKDGKVVMDENYACGPTGNWSYYIPLYIEERAPSKIHQITIDEVIKEQEKEMSKQLKVRVEITPYIKKYEDSYSVDLDFNHPVYVKSVSLHDRLIEIEHDGHKFMVDADELRKAITCCSGNEW